MATKKSSSSSGSAKSGNVFAAAAKMHANAYSKANQDMVGSQEARANQATQEMSAIARDLLGKSKSFTVKGLVQETVGEAIKEVAEVQSKFQKKMAELQTELNKKQKANAEGSTAELVKAIARLTGKIEDLQEGFDEDLEELLESVKGDKAADKNRRNVDEANKLLGTKIGKLLEKQNAKTAIKEALDRKREFISSRTDLLYSLENQRKAAIALDNKELADSIGRQIKAGKSKDFLAFEKIGESVEKQISELDSKIARYAIKQAADLKKGFLGRTADRLGGWVSGQAMRPVNAAKSAVGSIGIGNANLGNLGSFLSSKVAERQMGRALMANNAPASMSSGASSSATLAGMTASAASRAEITELKNINKNLANLGSSGSSGSLLDSAGDLAAKLLGLAGAAALKKIFGGKGAEASKKPTEGGKPKPVETPGEKGKVAKPSANPEGKTPEGKPASKTSPIVEEKVPEGKGIGNSISKILKVAGGALAVGVGLHEAYGAQKDFSEGKIDSDKRNARLAGAVGTTAQMASMPVALATFSTGLNSDEDSQLAKIHGDRKVGTDTKSYKSTGENSFKYMPQGGANAPAFTDSRRLDLPRGSDGVSGSGVAQGGDLKSMITVGSGVDLDQVQPKVKQNLFGLAKDYFAATGKKLRLTSGYRSYEKQLGLYNDWIARKPGARPANRPGSSLHEVGFAVDADPSQVNHMASMGLLSKHGFERITGKNAKMEEQHLQLAGSAAALSAAGNNASLVSGDSLGAPPQSAVSLSSQSVDVQAPMMAATQSNAISVASSDSSGGGNMGSSSGAGAGRGSGYEGGSSGKSKGASVTTASIPTFAYNDPAFFAMNVSAMA